MKPKQNYLCIHGILQCTVNVAKFRGSDLVSGASDGQIFIWNLASEETIRKIKVGNVFPKANIELMFNTWKMFSNLIRLIISLLGNNMYHNLNHILIFRLHFQHGCVIRLMQDPFEIFNLTV